MDSASSVRSLSELCWQLPPNCFMTFTADKERSKLIRFTPKEKLDQSFDGPTEIARLQGRGSVIESSHPEFASLAARFPEHPGTRAVIRIEVDRVSTSCGFSVPFFDYRGNRDVLDKWCEKKGPEGILE